MAPIMLMALSAMMFDGENEEFIKVFPAITEEWQSTGVSFGKFLATGNVEVSASFTNEKTNVTITNNSKKTVERTVLVRVAKGSGAATYNGTEYPIVDGYFAQIPVTVEAGETVDLASLKAKGLVDPRAKSVKVLATGKINKPLTVKAQVFSATAVKMIVLTGGKAIKVTTKVK